MERADSPEILTFALQGKIPTYQFHDVRGAQYLLDSILWNQRHFSVRWVILLPLPIGLSPASLNKKGFK